MRAARLFSYGEPLGIVEVPKPEPGPGQVLVRVEAAGFCHSDVHLIEGSIRLPMDLPITLGHENAGVVEQVGSGVQTVSEGDRVVVYGAWGDGTCDRCVSGEEQLCEAPRWSGLSDMDGGYAEYLLVPEERHLVPLGRLEPVEAAPLTDAGLTPYRAVKKALPELTPEASVLVVGVGGLGQYGVKLLSLLCGSKVIAVDLAERKRALALEYGAAHALDGREPDLVDEVRDLSGGGVAVALDFVGADQTIAQCVASTRTGGHVVQLGLSGGTASLKPMDNLSFEVRYEVSLWGSVMELREVIALAESGQLTPVSIETAPLESVNEVYERMRRGEIEGRAVIVP